MNAIQSNIQSLIRVELKAANLSNPLFHSAHEGYAVILEETDEANMEMVNMDEAINGLWESNKENDAERSAKIAKNIRRYATNLACEAVQVAAMCEKLLLYYGKFDI